MGAGKITTNAGQGDDPKQTELSLLQQWFSRLSPDLFRSPQADGDTREDLLDASDFLGLKESLLVSVERRAMACMFEVLFNQYQYDRATEVAIEALDLIELIEGRLSVYRPTSEISHLNRSGAEHPKVLSADSYELLELADDLREITEGAFDITAGALSEVWGFARREGRMPDQAALEVALSKVGGHHVQLNREDSTACLAVEDVKVNSGGIGKGFALDRVAQLLRAEGIHDFMVHGGLSSVVARGRRQNFASGNGWGVALKHPWRWEESLGTIRLSNAALGTSGSGKQFFHFGGRRYSHIIDPRTGQPAAGMMSATVVCPSGAVADALATALFVMGPKVAREFCEANQELMAVLVYQDEKSGRQKIDVLNDCEQAWAPV